ncbi:MAG: membrane protein YdbT [Bacteroidetes bacterium HLUCCA01]|nr:MAG: membrane protein YdbT [Bacteroidetes bacterium HLUCCA01]
MFNEPRRQHPVAIITNTLGVLRNLIVPAILAVFLGTGNIETDSEWAYLLRLAPIVAAVLITFFGGIARWYWFYYWLDDDELRVKQGLIVRKMQFIPRHRIQVIDISSGIIQRMFGLVSLNVQTAGGDTPGVIISALRMQEALAIRSMLRRDSTQPQTDPRTPAQSPPDSPLESITTNIRQEHHLSGDRLLIGAATSGGFGVFLSVLATIYSQVSGSVDEEQVLGWVSSIPLADQNLILTMIVVLILVAWTMSVGSFILKYANFRIRRLDRELVISKGLLERRQVTIPYRRIQAVRIVEGVLRQPFGYATIMVDSAGFGEKSGTVTELIPMVRRDEIPGFLAEFVPGFNARCEATRPPERSITRFIIQATILPLIAGIVLAAVTKLWYLIPVLMPVGVLLGYLRFRDTAAGVTDDQLFVGRYRNLARTTVMVPSYRIQSAQAIQNPFHRINKLGNVHISIASSNTGAQFIIPNLDVEDADELLQWTAFDHPRPLLSDELMLTLPALS